MIYQRLVPFRLGGRFNLGLQCLHKVPCVNLLSSGIKWSDMDSNCQCSQFLNCISVLLVIFTEPCLDKNKTKTCFQKWFLYFFFFLCKWFYLMDLEIMTGYVSDYVFWRKESDKHVWNETLYCNLYFLGLFLHLS